MYDRKLVITLFKETHPAVLEGEEALLDKNPYSVTKGEIADEINRRKINHMIKYVPVVFREGKPNSYLLELCSPEAALKMVLDDKVALIANLFKIDMVYLDEGRESVNPNAKTVGRLYDQTTLLWGMIDQILVKRKYLSKKLRKYREEIKNMPKGSEEQIKLSKKVGNIANKILATYVYNSDPLIESCYFPLDMSTKKHHNWMPAEKAVYSQEKWRFDLLLEVGSSEKFHEGREDFWLDRFKRVVKDLPPGSYVDVFVGAAHVDGCRVKGYDLNWRKIEKNRELNKVIGHFKEKLEREFGEIQVVDLTEETVKREIERAIVAKNNSPGSNP